MKQDKGTTDALVMLLVTLESSLHAAYLQVQITKPEVIHSFL